MFAYVCLGTNDLERAVKFYDAALAPLGFNRCNTGEESNWEGWAGWGIYEEGGAKELALWVCTPFDAKTATPQYASDFYAAYVRDPDGNKIAVVCRGSAHPE